MKHLTLESTPSVFTLRSMRKRSVPFGPTTECVRKKLHTLDRRHIGGVSEAKLQTLTSKVAAGDNNDVFSH